METIGYQDLVNTATWIHRIRRCLRQDEAAYILFGQIPKSVSRFLNVISDF